MQKVFVAAIMIIVGVGFYGCSTIYSPLAPVSIEVNASELYPEGIAYSMQKQHFYLGSYYLGAVVSVNFEGEVQEFVKDDSLVSVIGVTIDEANNRLLLCNADSGFSVKSTAATAGKLSEVVMYDLESGAKLQTVTLSSLIEGEHFVNDLCLDRQGNIYVTDSFSPAIYKINSNGDPSVWIEHKYFKSAKGSFGLNGIVCGDDYVIVAKSDEGKLFKVPLKDPKMLHEIHIDGVINSIDGLLLRNNGTLIVVSNNFSDAPYEEAVYQIETNDDWKSGMITAVTTLKGKVFPTTLTVAEGALYVNYSYLPRLIMKADAPKQFKIHNIRFEVQ